MLLVSCALTLTFSACSRTPSAPAVLEDEAITVASFNFDESEIVAEIYAQALEASGFTVDRAPQVGTRELVLPALQRGLVEVVPEYSGSAVSFLGGSPTADREQTLTQLRELLRDRGIGALGQAPAQDRNALVVSAEVADSLSLESIGDLIPYANGMTLGGPPECPDRPLCLPGLQHAYHLTFDSFLPLEGGGALTAEAIARGTVDAGVMFTTDGALSSDDLVVLDDDRHLQPAENLTPLVREDTLARFGPGLRDTLDLVSAALTTKALRDLNDEVEGGSDAATVAAGWLADHDLGIPPGSAAASRAPQEGQ